MTQVSKSISELFFYPPSTARLYSMNMNGSIFLIAFLEKLHILLGFMLQLKYGKISL